MNACKRQVHSRLLWSCHNFVGYSYNYLYICICFNHLTVEIKNNNGSGYQTSANHVNVQTNTDTSSTVCIASQGAPKTCHIHLTLHVHVLSCKNHLLISPVARTIRFHWISMDTMYIKHYQTYQSYQENQFPKNDKTGKYTQTNIGAIEFTQSIPAKNWRTTNQDRHCPAISNNIQYLRLLLSMEINPFHSFFYIQQCPQCQHFLQVNQ